MKKPVLPYANNKGPDQPTQSDQRICCSLPRQYNISCFCIWNLKPLAGLCSWAGRFESYLVENPEDRFSRDEAQLIPCDMDEWSFET